MCAASKRRASFSIGMLLFCIYFSYINVLTCFSLAISNMNLSPVVMHQQCQAAISLYQLTSPESQLLICRNKHGSAEEISILVYQSLF